MQLPKRRWLRFSIRTLLVAVTIFCVCLAWQASAVRERVVLRALIEEQGGLVAAAGSHQSPYAPTVINRWLGDEEIESVEFTGKPPSLDLQQRIEKTFPEAAIYVHPEGRGIGQRADMLFMGSRRRWLESEGIIDAWKPREQESQ